MAPDQRGRREAQEADRVGDLAGLARVDHRLVEGDLPPPVAHAGIDDAERLHPDAQCLALGDAQLAGGSSRCRAVFGWNG